MGWYGALPQVEIPDPLGPGWTVIRGDAFDHQPVFGDPWYFRGTPGNSAGFEGNWWIGTAEAFDGPMMGSYPGQAQGDQATGAVRSAAFTLSGLSMRLLVGGGCCPGECYVALRDAETGKVLFTETGRGSEMMDERIWDIEGLKGRSVYIEIADDSAEPFGHINVDGIVESPYHLLPPDPSLLPGRPGKEIDAPFRESAAGTDGAAAPQQASASISCSPNPFNPSTVITYASPAGTPCTLRIYDVAGRLLWSGAAEAGPTGEGSVRWDGKDASGRPCASGVYVAALVSGRSVAAIAKLVLMR